MIIKDEDILARIDDINAVYPEPQCYFVALLLVSHFGGDIFYDHNHCVSLIKGKFWDKNGQVPFENTKNYLQMGYYGKAQEWALIDAMIQKHGKKIKVDEKIRRECDCWLGKTDQLDMSCYCPLDSKSVRFGVVDFEGITHSRWETLNEALQDGRKHLKKEFKIWDSIENDYILIYE